MTLKEHWNEYKIAYIFWSIALIISIALALWVSSDSVYCNNREFNTSYVWERCKNYYTK